MLNSLSLCTLIKILAGEVSPEKGEVILPQRLSLRSLRQDHYLYKSQVILDVVIQGRAKLWDALTQKKELLL